jgi:hypothetical protein
MPARLYVLIVSVPDLQIIDPAGEVRNLVGQLAASLEAVFVVQFGLNSAYDYFEFLNPIGNGASDELPSCDYRGSLFQRIMLPILRQYWDM